MSSPAPVEPAPTPRSVDLVLTAGVVVTVDDADRVVHSGAVAVHDGVVVDVGPADEVLRRVVADTRVDLPDHLLMPGFVNAHTHLSMTMFRGFTDDLDLSDFLSRVVPAEVSVLDAHTVGVGTRAAALESVLGGVTTALDMYFFPESGLAAATVVGLRAMTGPVVLDNEGIHALGPDALVDDPASWLRAHPPGPGWRPVVAPHAVYTVSRARLVHAGELATEHDAVFHIHAAETVAEVQGSVEANGRRPVELLDDLGLLGPRTVIAHGVHLTDDEIERLARGGSSVAHCPASNLKLASGVAPVPALLDAGVNVAIGTDGAATSNDLDMFMALRLTALLHKGVGGDPTVVPAHRALRMATMGGARALGLDQHLGSIEVGKLADLVAVDLDRPHLQPVYDAAASVVYAAGRGDVTDVWVGGRPVVRRGEPTAVDAGAVTAELAALRSRVLATLA
jgi:5-methylthioadenosine/S-adenosylhomocysteine deaminase